MAEATETAAGVAIARHVGVFTVDVQAIVEGKVTTTPVGAPTVLVTTIVSVGAVDVESVIMVGA